MDPASIGPEQWDRIGRALVSLSAFVALTLTGGLAFLLGHGVVPSLAAGGDPRTDGAERLRSVLDPLFAISLVLALVALGRALVLAVDVLRELYPRFLI